MALLSCCIYKRWATSYSEKQIPYQTIYFRVQQGLFCKMVITILVLRNSIYRIELFCKVWSAGITNDKSYKIFFLINIKERVDPWFSILLLSDHFLDSSSLFWADLICFHKTETQEIHVSVMFYGLSRFEKHKKLN